MGLKHATVIALTCLAAALVAAAFSPSGAQTANPPTAEQKLAGDEVALAEEVVSAREKYLKNLEALNDFYTRTRNDFKALMTKEELDGLRKVVRHDYIIIAESLGADLKPLKSIAEAEAVFAEARALDTRAGGPVDENRRKALGLYNGLLARWPESNRIAEAAFYAGQIYENVAKDYFSAVVYYQRTYQWDPQTSHPARILAARLAYTKIKDLRRAKGYYQSAADSDPDPACRAEGKAMVDALTAMGY
jgi:tetratricopeptide (TPR) repeat protein